MTHADDLEITLPSDTEIRVTRSFKAPPELVYEAVTNPEHLRIWWGGHERKMSTCEVDLRVGGGYRFVLRGPDGQAHGFHGEYRELEPGRRIVQTFVYEPVPEAWALETLELQATDGGTRWVALLKHRTREYRDGHLGSGMEEGLRQSMNALEDHLAAVSIGRHAAI